MDEMTDEEIERIVIDECGRALLSLIGSAKRLGHVSMKGHLVYQHERRGTISGDAIAWIRWMTSYGEEARNEVGYPEDLADFAERWVVKQVSKNLSGAANG
jgi:hypothetical protein